MSLNRRHILRRGAAIVVSAWSNARFAMAAEPAAMAALYKSPLIYLSPIVSNGRESSCHAEVWFVLHDSEIFVVTWSDKWKAEAMRRGFSRAKIWIGDFGPWKQANEAYLSAPSLLIEGRFESDPVVHETLLQQFASKYETEWPFWDRRVRSGLTNGGWVLMRYRVVS